eukprot:CAMPEP_0182944896 /NCGR_PEP_ID=MMETSP0105_2-20130417/54695_1 /TAXON_ID=81532 ORGANISM="Acanthoeca-like sp., Strain 10tr" /NCGR_SAMPLE_ID=MMETSP0105_2 /ASSEMBLY_ACC=CAM_ASM_000205 /LENGTH=352 /DNA_ID=CAMNT_0025084865 /DNA_START=6 /DNA_END=1064 /DNA_ORIENTATION=+
MAAAPGQGYRRAARKAFSLTVMVAGERCLGKTTLIETLFGEATAGAEEGSGAPKPPGGDPATTVAIEARSAEVIESGVPVKLTIVDTPGFGTGLDNRDDMMPLGRYIDEAFREYLEGECRPDRSGLVDRRVHCLLYFVRPGPGGLQPLDLVTLEALAAKVNVVPLLAKADTLTVAERSAAKAAVVAQLADRGIPIFRPAADPADEPELQQQCAAIAAAVPFAVVGSTTHHEVGGREVRGRKYGWGVVDVGNPAHCDTALLRRMLVSTHLEDLKGLTEERHYEQYRKDAFAQGGVLPAPAPEFARTAEQELQRKHEDMKRALEEQERRLEERRRQFEEERKLYDAAKRTQNSS